VRGSTGRGHNYKVFKRRFRLDVGKFKFGNRVCDEWNGLRDEIVNALTLNSFKAKLDNFFRHVKGYC